MRGRVGEETGLQMYWRECYFVFTGSCSFVLVDATVVLAAVLDALSMAQ